MGDLIVIDPDTGIAPASRPSTAPPIKTTPLADGWRRALRPPDRRPIPVWASEFVTMPAVITVSGKFQPEISRHLIEIFEALQNDLVRRVTLMKPVRGAGSLVADIWTAWLVANDPGAMMCTFQSDDAGKRFAENRINPIIERCPPAAAYLPRNRHHKRTQEILFSHGMPLYTQGPALGNLQAQSARYLRNEEIWMWPPGRYEEVIGRIGDYEEMGMSKVFNISQGGISDDPLDVESKAGDQREWHVQCQSCSHYMPAEFGGKRPDGTLWGVRWDDGEEMRDRAGDWIPDRVLSTVRYECEKCGHPHVDEIATKANWNRTGKYVRMNPRAHVTDVSFHFSAVITRSWVRLVKEFLIAQNFLRIGILDPYIAFVQKRDARSWSEEKLSQEKEGATYEVNTSWPDEHARAMTVDRQAEGVHWAMVGAWSKAGEFRRLWYGKLFSEDEIKEKQAEYSVPSRHVLIDSGHDAKVVYAMCVRNDWIALKGDDRKFFLHQIKKGKKQITLQRSYSKPVRADPEIGKVYQGRRFAILIHWSNPTIKDRLKAHIDSKRFVEPVADPNDEAEKEYRRQMRGEWKERRRHPTTGRTIWLWRDNGNNHAFDCAAMMMLFGILKRVVADQQAHLEKEFVDGAGAVDSKSEGDP